MKRRVVIRAFTLRRDVAAALLLAEVLRCMGCDVIVASARNFQRSLRLWRPHAVVYNTLSQVDAVARMAPQALRVYWPGEGSEARDVSDARLLADRPEDLDKIDLILLWGRLAEGFFREFLPEADPRTFALCGNPRLDLVGFNDRLSARRERARSIGFVGRFNSINHYDGRPTIYSLTQGDNLESVISQCRGYAAVVATVRHLVANTDFPISIRPHPLEAPENYRYLKRVAPDRIEIDDSIDFAAWAAAQRVLVTPSSTSFLEAYLLRVPVINLDYVAGEVEHFRRIQPYTGLAADMGPTPRSLEELVRCLEDIPPPPVVPEIEAHLAEAHNWPTEGSAVRRAAAAIVDALAARPSAGPALPRFCLDAIDRVSFARACQRNPLHPNFNYMPAAHPIPSYFPAIVDNIMAAPADVAVGTAVA